MRRVLVDECLPTALHRLIAGCEVRTAAFMGWRGLPDGELIRRADALFDVFLTADRGISHQQNLTGVSLAVVILSTERLSRLANAVEIIADAIVVAEPGRAVRIAIP